MGMVLAVGTIIQCTHKGMCRLAQGNSKLTVKGNAIITSGMETGISFAPGAPGLIAPCPHPDPTGSPSPCTATSPTFPSGIARKLSVDGIGALLDGASGPAINLSDPFAQWSVVSAGQTLLRAD